MTSDNLRLLPAVHQIVGLLRKHDKIDSERRLTWAARLSIQQARDRVVNDDQATMSHDEILSLALHFLRHSGAPQKVINATGVILHTNLGRAPLSEAALSALTHAAQSSDLEYDLETGSRASRNRLLARHLAELTNTEDGFIVNNCAAALVLALAGLGGTATALARSQIIEIGGGFRLPDIMKASGVELKEVGTTNRVRLKDYEEALQDGATAILWMHRSNFEIRGFTEEPTLESLRVLADKFNVPLIYDLGTGLKWDVESLNLPPEPTIDNKAVELADVSLFSGDKLFGGPQAGVLVGKSSAIKRLSKHPLARALRADKLTIAAFAATLMSHLNETPEELPIYQMLTVSKEDLRQRAQRVVSNLEGVECAIVDVVDTVGGGTMPSSELPGIALELTPPDVEKLHKSLRNPPLPIITRIKDGTVLVHLRTVPWKELDAVTHKLADILLPK